MKETRGDGYFDASHNPNLHWHIDTWTNEDTPYFEAIAWERKHDGSWDIFFDQFLDDSEMFSVCGEDLKYIKDLGGVFLFNSHENEVEAKLKFWIEGSLLKHRKKKS